MQKSVEAGFMDKDIYADFLVGDNSDDNYNKVDLHKNVVDQIILKSASGKPMKREADLIDVWFDSVAMNTAQWHYTQEIKVEVEHTKIQADIIAEGVYNK